MLDRRLAVLGEAVGERAGAGQRVWVRRVVDVLCGQGDVSVREISREQDGMPDTYAEPCACPGRR